MKRDEISAFELDKGLPARWNCRGERLFTSVDVRLSACSSIFMLTAILYFVVGRLAGRRGSKN